MAKRPKKAAKKKPIESYDHTDKQRVNNPPVGLVTPETDPDKGKKAKYQYDEHLDPQLVWAGKAEHTSFEVPTVSLHVHERIDPRTIIEATRNKKRRELFEAQDRIGEQRYGLIGKIQKQLKQRQNVETLFVVRWKLA